MKQFQYKYYTDSVFLPAVEWHFFKLRTIPCCNEFQQVEVSRFEVTPSCRMGNSVDGQGNAVQWGSYDYDHTEFHVVSEGHVVQTKPYLLHESPAPFYLTPTRLTTCVPQDARLETIKHACSSGDRSKFDVARELMHFVHSTITYTPCHTSTTTTAAEVWDDPRGVCQDYAHLMIALCRNFGLAARYVNGLIDGEGQTHAWVEVSDGTVWRAFDPTHDTEVEWGYVKIAHGRDADDCPTNRGRFYGWTQEQQSVFCKLICLSDSQDSLEK